jgi:hypothetical protein
MDFMEETSNPQLIVSWKAPLRAYKKRGKKILRFYAALALLLSLIVFFIGDKILMIPILTLLFLFYVLTITPPPEVENKITTFGIDTAGISIRWETLSHFYFTRKFNFNILTLVSHPPYNYHAFLVVPDDALRGKLTQLLSQHIMYMEKPQRRFTDRLTDWILNLMPEDDDKEAPLIPPLSQKPPETTPLRQIASPI